MFRRMALSVLLVLPLLSQKDVQAQSCELPMCSSPRSTCLCSNVAGCTCPDTLFGECIVSGYGVWPGGAIPYAFDPSFPAADIPKIQAAMRDWTKATNGIIVFNDVTNVSMKPPIYARVGTGTDSSAGYSRCASVPSDCHVNLEPGRAYHELGHLIGLPHETSRADRDHYVRINQTVFANGSPVRNDCTFHRCATVGGAFGPYDFQSAMHYAPTDPDITRWDYTPICGGQPCKVCNAPAAQPLWFSLECTSCTTQGSPGAVITRGDASKINEIYQYGSGWWDKFSRAENEPAANTPEARKPYPGVITGNVRIVGSPAVETWENGTVGIYVRGTDNQFYFRLRNGTGAAWGQWTVMANGVFTSDPAVVFRGSGKRDVVGRGSDGQIYISTSSSANFQSPSWTGSWWSLGAPGVGAASAPAITSWGAGRLDVFVRGTDNKLYWKRCSSITTDCSVTSGNWSGWQLVNSNGTFKGKPSAVGRGSAIDVFVHGMDEKVWGIQFAFNAWGSFYQVTATNSTLNWYNFPSGAGGPCAFQLAQRTNASDDCYSPAVNGRPNGLDLIVRGVDEKAWVASYTNGGSWQGFTPIGGVLTSSPAMPTSARSVNRIDLIATMDEERAAFDVVHTLWWKQYPKP